MASGQHAEVSGGPPRLAVVVFSKDRPFQLCSCLASLLRSVEGVFLEVFVLFRASSGRFADGYRVLRSFFAGATSGGAAKFHFEEETDDRPLGELLDASLKQAQANKASGLLFTVDDALWLRKVNVAVALSVLDMDSNVYAFHLKLCPRIEYAHPNSKFMRVPSFHAAPVAAPAAAASGGGALAEEPDILLFDRSQGEYDWNYPWELSASIYRLEDVGEMFAAIREHFGSPGLNHPNHLEGYGVRLFKQEKVSAARSTTRCACCSKPLVAVVTINRVQALFENPVYGRNCRNCRENNSRGQPSDEVSPLELDAVFRASLRQAAEDVGFSRSIAAGSEGAAARLHVLRDHLEPPGPEWDAVVAGARDALVSVPPRPLFDLDVFQAEYLDSVHVPWLTSSSSRIPPMLSSPRPLVSWLMPVRDTPADWLHQAILSIENQRGFGPGSWELVLVDDGTREPGTVSFLATAADRPGVRVLRQPSDKPGGIGRALNTGWPECRGDFIARLDGDDVAHADRLLLQVAFLEAHPSLAAVGGGFRTFRDHNELHEVTALAKTKRYRMPCHPILARWQMMFGCSLAHPTVVFRRAALAFDHGPYPEGEEAEDHCCWLTLPWKAQYANVADVVSYLRRHSGSRTAESAAAIRTSSFRAVRGFLRCFAGIEDLTDNDVAVLWGTSKVASAEQARRLSVALDAAEAAFLARVIGSVVCDSKSDSSAPAGFFKDFVEERQVALTEYIRASCSKLRGCWAVQALAEGDLSSGTEMMKLWLNSGDGSGAPTGSALKSLGALVGAGFTV